jgi:hypothetical protein
VGHKAKREQNQKATGLKRKAFFGTEELPKPKAKRCKGVCSKNIGNVLKGELGRGPLPSKAMESHQRESESEAVQRGYKKSRRLKGSF